MITSSHESELSEDRLVAPTVKEGDIEVNLRPERLFGFVGKEAV